MKNFILFIALILMLFVLGTSVQAQVTSVTLISDTSLNSSNDTAWYDISQWSDIGFWAYTDTAINADYYVSYKNANEGTTTGTSGWHTAYTDSLIGTTTGTSKCIDLRTSSVALVKAPATLIRAVVILRATANGGTGKYFKFGLAGKKHY